MSTISADNIWSHNRFLRYSHMVNVTFWFLLHFTYRKNAGRCQKNRRFPNISPENTWLLLPFFVTPRVRTDQECSITTISVMVQSSHHCPALTVTWNCGSLIIFQPATITHRWNIPSLSLLYHYTMVDVQTSYIP